MGHDEVGPGDDEVLADFQWDLENAQQRIDRIETVMDDLKGRLAVLSEKPFDPKVITALSDGINDLYEVKAALPESIGGSEAVAKLRLVRDQALGALKSYQHAARRRDAQAMLAAVQKLGRLVEGMNAHDR